LGFVVGCTTLLEIGLEAESKPRWKRKGAVEIIILSFHKNFWGIVFSGGGFKYFLFSPLLGEDEPILTSIFFKWVDSTTN